MSTELEARLAAVQSELDALRAEYNDYAYAVSHDLAAPFRQIEGFASIILSKHEDLIDEKSRRHFDLIIKGAEKGSSLVDALLGFSRIRTATMHLTAIDCNTVVADVFMELSGLFQGTNAEYSCAKLPVIEGDSTQIRMLFYHVIHNALLYHKPGSQPAIAIDAIEAEAVWEFRIGDNGIGIPDKQMDKVFTVLKRAVVEKDYPGLGMGLALAKCIVQQHRGSIWIKKNEDNGCSVHFTLPKPTCDA